AGPDEARLVGYYTGPGPSAGGVAVETLRTALLQTLPEYMVPAAYVWVAAWPLTPNGKLDRQALPAPEATAYVTRGYEPPQGAVETMLAAIWAEVLHGEGVGRHDDFC